jgi:hypothetical protein
MYAVEMLLDSGDIPQVDARTAPVVLLEDVCFGVAGRIVFKIRAGEEADVIRVGGGLGFLGWVAWVFFVRGVVGMLSAVG